MKEGGFQISRVALGALLLVCAGLAWWVPAPPRTPGSRAAAGGEAVAQPQRPSAIATARPASIEPPARLVAQVPVENLFQLTPNLYSGGGPEGDEAFAALARLGIQTLISVDGAPPDVELARRHGMKYVHLPIGYDGVRSERLPQLLKAVRELPGPVLVHCHHGRHRGPAAAALCAVGAAGWTRPQALAWLGQAGTDPAYRGLHRDVAELPVPPAAETARLVAQFPEQVTQRGLTEAMLQIDVACDRLKAAAKRDWRGVDQLGRAPVEAALDLLEGYRELSRDSQVEARGADFLNLLAQATGNANDLHARLAPPAEAGPTDQSASANQATPGTARPADPGPLEVADAWRRVTADCKACHQRFRDNVGSR